MNTMFSSEQASATRCNGDTTELHTTEIARERRAMQQRFPALTVLAGSLAGKTLRLSGKPFTMGRDRGCDLRCSDSGVSRRHAVIEHESTDNLIILDNGSTNGTFVNGHRIRMSKLSNGDTVYLGPITSINLSYITERELRLRVDQHDHATRDQLTGLRNRRCLLSSLSSEVAFAARYRTKLCFVMFDIDHFKSINDTYGHPVGDAVLRQVAETAGEQLREEDVLARYGGEEFAVILRGLSEKQAFGYCERIRKEIQNLPLSHNGTEFRTTISLGFAMLDTERDQNSDGLLARTDEYLYRAKQAGRNRTVGP